MGDAEQAPVQETIKEEDEAQPEEAAPEPSAPEEPKPTECGEPDPEPVPDEPEPANDDSAPPPSEPEPEPQQELESEPEQTPTEPEQPPAPPGEPIEKEELEQKIQDNEELSNQLESTLSNQNAESESYKKLTDENARLQKHHDDMKAKLEDIEGGHMLLLAEVETLRKVNHEQKETVSKLESEIKILKETQGGDENIKDMQDKLIRLSNEQEDKDRTIHSLQGELDQTKEALKDAEARAARNGNSANANPKSKTCIVM